MRKLTSIAAIGALSFFLVACGDSESTNDDNATTQETETTSDDDAAETAGDDTGADETDATDSEDGADESDDNSAASGSMSAFALTEADFPEGYEVTVTDSSNDDALEDLGDLGDLSEGLQDLADEITFEPAECSENSEGFEALTDANGTSAFGFHSTTGESISVILLDQEINLDDHRDYLKKCGTITMQMGGDGGDVSITSVEAEGLTAAGADDQLNYEQTTSMEFSGQSVENSLITYFAVVDGMTIMVMGSADTADMQMVLDNQLAKL